MFSDTSNDTSYSITGSNILGFIPNYRVYFPLDRSTDNIIIYPKNTKSSKKKETKNHFPEELFEIE